MKMKNCSRPRWESTSSIATCSYNPCRTIWSISENILSRYAIKDRHVSGYIFKGYWEDIGTIRAFYEANLDLTDVVPRYSFFEPDAPIYTHPRFLPGSKINGATLRQAIISDGCIISDAHMERLSWGYAALSKAARPSGTALSWARIIMNRQTMIPRRAADRHRTQLRDRSRDHRQKCPHRRWRCDYAGRQAAKFGCRQLFHPRRHRRGTEKRGHSRRASGFSGVWRRSARRRVGRYFPISPVCSKGWRTRFRHGSRQSCGSCSSRRKKRRPCAQEEEKVDNSKATRITNLIPA